MTIFLPCVSGLFRVLISLLGKLMQKVVTCLQLWIHAEHNIKRLLYFYKCQSRWRWSWKILQSCLHEAICSSRMHKACQLTLPVSQPVWKPHLSKSARKLSSCKVCRACVDSAVVFVLKKTKQPATHVIMLPSTCMQNASKLTSF